MSKVCRINDDICYIEGYESPLSSDIALIRNEDSTWLFDVGMGPEIIKDLSGSYKVVLSHFHPDHVGNIEKVKCDNLYVSKETFKHIHVGEIVESDLYFGNIHIFLLPSSHAKGCLGLEVGGEYAFLGDALCPKFKDGNRIYNAQLLKTQIDLLKSLKAKYVLLSHEMGSIIDKTEKISELESIYKMRNKDSFEIVF
ncbi:MAG: MBL fold metallo-hydrolase [Lachnospiraceae bacterium]|nr:MBL fold metallo-hydrolase [Lachnospiraceae bacterium]